MIREKDNDTRMLFHNAVMRQKCSLLTEAEKHDLQAWIDEDAQMRWELVTQPWKANQTKGVDQLTAENQYIQR